MNEDTENAASENNNAPCDPNVSGTGASLYHPLTGELLHDGGSGPQVEANRAALKRRCEAEGMVHDIDMHERQRAEAKALKRNQ